METKVEKTGKKRDMKKFLIGTAVTVQILLLVGMVGLFFQNSKLADSLAQYIGSNTQVHEIWDDTAVVEAYKSGKTDGLSEQDLFVLDTAKKVIKDNIKDGMTDYEKEKAIYDWQVDYVYFNSDNLAPINMGQEVSHLPYGVLKFHQAICVGNATTFKLFMDILGIDCEIIHSTASGEHAWNVVKLDDEWYHADVTFDGGSKGQPGYTYFNVPDSVKDDGTYTWNHDEIPAANGTKYCYISNQAKALKNIYEIPALIKEGMDNKSSKISFTLEDATGYNTANADFINSAFAMGTTSVYTGTVYAIGQKTIYSVSIVNDGGSDTGADNDKIIQKLQEAIDKAMSK